MATRGVSITVTYQAWDTSGNAYKTGDVANHTLYWTKDGTASAATNSPSEVDATHLPGLYKLTLTATECTCDSGTLGGKSSTANIILIPTSVTFENTATFADGLLDRNLGTGTDSGGRTVRNALRPTVNKVVVASGTVTVYKEDDSTTAWTGSETGTSGADPITAVDPA